MLLRTLNKAGKEGARAKLVAVLLRMDPATLHRVIACLQEKKKIKDSFGSLSLLAQKKGSATYKNPGGMRSRQQTNKQPSYLYLAAWGVFPAFFLQRTEVIRKRKVWKECPLLSLQSNSMMT